MAGLLSEGEETISAVEAELRAKPVPTVVVRAETGKRETAAKLPAGLAHCILTHRADMGSYALLRAASLPHCVPPARRRHRKVQASAAGMGHQVR